MKAMNKSRQHSVWGAGALAASLSGARLHQRPEQHGDLCAGFSSGLLRLPTWPPFFCLPSAPGDGSALNVTRYRAYSSYCSVCRGTFLSTHLAKGLRLCWPLWRPPLTWPFSFQSAPLCVGGDSFISRVLSRILFSKCPLVAHSGRATRADECLLLGPKRTWTNRCLPNSIYEYTA